MQEYKGVKYEKKEDGWYITWPSGVKTIAKLVAEEELLKLIDNLTKEAT